MKHFKLLLILLMVACAGNGYARTISVIGTDGVPVPYAAVTTEAGKLIGTTDVNGTFDAADYEVVCISQVAYNPITVIVSQLTDGVVVMQDADYVLPDVVVKPKELLYVQTYYRMTYINEDGPIYYRAGIIDNTYEFAKRKISSKSKSISAAENGILKFAINTLVGGQIEDYCKLQEKSDYERVISKEGKAKNLTVTTDATGRQVISDEVSVLGFITEDKKAGTRTTTLDHWLLNMHLDIAGEKNEKKKQKKQDKLEKEEQESERCYYEVYRIDDEGRSSVGDFVMQQVLVKGVSKRSRKSFVIVLESFATETAYIDKNEFKQTRKDNDVDKNYNDLLRYEQAHHIPALAPHLKTQVDKLFEKK